MTTEEQRAYEEADTLIMPSLTDNIRDGRNDTEPATLAPPNPHQSTPVANKE